MDDKPVYLYGVRAKKEFGSLYQHVEASDPEEAFGKLGLKAEEVRRYQSIKCVTAAKPMPEEVKQQLRKLNEERRALRRKEPKPAKQPTKAEVKGSAKGAEGKTMKTKKTTKTSPKTEQLKALREKAVEENEKQVKPTKVKKEAVKKETPKKKTASPSRTISLPQKFVREYHGKSFTVEQKGDAWMLNGKSLSTLREVMLAIFKATGTEPGHRAPSYFFAPNCVRAA